MDTTEFTTSYDCQVQFQYLFNGKSKQYYPIISNLHADQVTIDLTCFADYSTISFQDCELQQVTLKLDTVRDINFQHCTLAELSFKLDKFGGRLGIANSTINLSRLITTSSPRILALVESVIVGLQHPDIQGFDQVHTLALIHSSVDYLDLQPLQQCFNIQQLVIRDIAADHALQFIIPHQLQHLEVENITWFCLPEFVSQMELRNLTLHQVQIHQYQHELSTLSQLSQLQCLKLIGVNIAYLPDFNIPALEELVLDQEIEIDDKLQARMKFSGMSLTRVSSGMTNH